MDREQPWRDDAVPRGIIVAVSRNPISAAIREIGAATGHDVHLLAEDDGGPGLTGLELTAKDAVVLCDHDAPDAPRVLREALASPAGYVAMMASRARAAKLLPELEAEGVAGLDKLHVPAGLDIGGKSAGDIALSVVAEIVAEAHGRSGGPMRGPRP